MEFYAQDINGGNQSDANENASDAPLEETKKSVEEKIDAQEKIEDVKEQVEGKQENTYGERIEEPAIEAEKETEESQENNEEAPAEKRWYVIQTYSGQEDKVKQAIEQNVDMLGLRQKISKVLVPEEDVVEVHGKKRVEKKKKMYPGYVFLEMGLDDESWYAIRQTPGVARFIGTKVRPTPVSDREMQRVLKQIGIKEERLEIAFEKGEAVRVISGPFRGYTGSIDEINADKGKLKVLINIFGRDTPVEVNFEHAEKLV